MASSAYQAELEAICPEDWKVVPLTDAVIFQEGPGILAKDFQSSGVPLIRLKGVEGDFVSLEGCNFLAPEKVASKWSHFRLERGDLVISTSASFGRVSEVTEESAGAVPYTGLIRFQPKTKEIDAGFLRAFLGSSAFMQQVEAMASGSVIRHFGPMHLKQMALPLPPLGEQRAIGNMAKLFAERLRNQSQTNESLEAMARTLFKAWFVDFEPVRAKMEGRWQRGQSLPGLPAHLYDLFPDRLVESESGEIPEGWRHSTIGEEVAVCGGSTPSTKEPKFWQGGQHCWVTPKDLSTLKFPVLLGTDRKITDAGLARISSGLLPVGTVLLSSRAPIGYLAIAEVPTAINQGFIAMKCDGILPNTFVLQWCKENMDAIIGNANGSTFQEISKSNFRPIPVVVPPKPVLESYQEISGGLYRQTADNERQSRTLAQLRDTLLPKLISGELRVSRSGMESIL
ncbi:restriction endonuclease subunit S [Cardiobacterium hominis]|uniref:restriction endonuclease subunit S n=1 Tax=Cardiobacterium hominis TaxID=2718 RepID=UPI00069EBB28|nr:restriction endonuclease subunit S [Cardiobacterium hominis]